MAKTAVMRLVELMIMNEDIDNVLAYLGKKGVFQFYNASKNLDTSNANPAKEMFDTLTSVRNFLGIADINEYTIEPVLPKDADFARAGSIIGAVDALREKQEKAKEESARISDAYKEACAFSHLKASYSELEHLTFLTMRIGKIDPAVFEDLQFALGERCTVIPLGDDKTRILAASSKKARFALDTELKKFGFVPLEIPRDFKGIPNDMLLSMKKQTEEAKNALDAIDKERVAYANEHKDELLELLQIFSVGMQVQVAKDQLESTQLVYRVTGWLPLYETDALVKELDDLSEGRVAIRQFKPEEIASIRDGRESVPVKLRHGKFIKSFEGMIFSYGAPKYGTIDPTPFVAFFFTLLFGVMFGDAGQGLVFVLIGILLNFNLIHVKGWNKYGLIFIAIGISSCVMGLLTGEFFANGKILEPFALFVTGLFVGKENAFAPILHLMPSSDTLSLLFIFFGFTLSVGFVINSLGLVLNFINNISQRRFGEAFFGKTSLTGALFFWYVIALAIRIAFTAHAPALYDWIILGVLIFTLFFAHPLERLVNGHKPIFENGIFVGIIEGIVEIIEVASSYISNTVSFLRVGAFALAHVVLGFIIYKMQQLIGGVGGLAVAIVGNVIVIVLEGMIVAIQVIRLQYYEFFSKFFSETGVEFKPFKLSYK